jgi:hypothetical protein
MKKKPKSKASRLPPRTAHEAEREEHRRRVASGLRRERKIRQLARQLTREIAGADRALRVLAQFVLERDGDAEASSSAQRIADEAPR